MFEEKTAIQLLQAKMMHKPQTNKYFCITQLTCQAHQPLSRSYQPKYMCLQLSLISTKFRL